MSRSSRAACESALVRACECARGRDEASCRCRTEAALVEFRRTGRCQACQDAEHLARHPSDPSVSYRVRTGAVAAMSVASGLAETAFLPFRWTVPGGPFAWDTVRIVRVGAWLAPVDWTDEWAGVLAEVLEGHLFSFHTFARFEGEEQALRPLLGDVELLIGVNERAVSLVRRCVERVCPDTLGVGLEELYLEAFRHPLGGLGAFVFSHGWTDWSGARRATPSALRLVSWIGAVLSMRAGPGLRLFDVVLDRHRGALGLPADATGPGCDACAVPALEPR